MSRFITAGDPRADGGGQVDQYPAVHARPGDARQADHPSAEKPQGTD